MSMHVPYIASPLQARIPAELEGLFQRSRSHLIDADKKLGGELLTETYCDLIDACFTHLLEDINRTHPSKVLLEAQTVAEDIKAKARHYVGWVIGFLANDRLPPVIAHFHGLVHTLDLGDGDKPYMAFNISPKLAAEAQRVLATLHDGSATSIDEGIELLIEAVEEAIVPLAMHPKDLMKFNFIVDRTLDGVIALIRKLFTRMLRKLAPHLPRELYPRVAAHLETFLIVSTHGNEIDGAVHCEGRQQPA